MCRFNKFLFYLFISCISKDVDIGEQRIQDLLAEIENVSEVKNYNKELPPLRKDDSSDNSATDELVIWNEVTTS